LYRGHDEERKKERKKEIEENSISKALEKRKRLFKALKYALGLRVREGRRGSTGTLTVRLLANL
jgi:hypothetical protein